VKRLCVIAIALFSLAFVASCDDPAPAQISQFSPLSSPLVNDTAQPPEPRLSDASLGGVKGRLIYSETSQPIGGLTLYLGEQLALEPGPQYAITVQQNSSPNTVVDENGYFAFVDIKPGTYALVLWNPFKSLVVVDPNDSGKELQIVITSGQIVDLGSVISGVP